MSGGFFRGTSADQDTRFSNKQAKLLKSQKFASELENLVDMTKVKMDVMKPWIAKRVIEIIGVEDEVLINFIYGLLEGKAVNGKHIQISITGFMGRNTGKFMKELWVLLLSAQQNVSGVPQQFLDAKEEESKNKKAETDRIANEIRIKKENDNQQKTKMGDDGEISRVKRAELNLKHNPIRPMDGNEIHKRNGSRGRSRGSVSSESATASGSPPLRRRQRSRSISRTPSSRSRSISSERPHQFSPRRSVTPRRRHNIRQSPSPPARRSSYSKKRSVSPRRHRSPSPTRHQVRSTWRSRRSHSPMCHRSRSPIRRRSRTPMRRSPVRSPLRRRSPSPVHRRSPYPVRHRSPSTLHPKHSSQCLRSLAPVRRSNRRSSSSPERSASPVLRRSSMHYQKKFPPVSHRSPSSLYSSSLSPTRRSSISPIRGGSPRNVAKSPLQSPGQRDRNHEKYSTAHHASSKDGTELIHKSSNGSKALESRPTVYLRSPQRDVLEQNDFRVKERDSSPYLQKAVPGFDGSRDISHIGRRSSSPCGNPYRKREGIVHPESRSSLPKADGPKLLRELVNTNDEEKFTKRGTGELKNRSLRKVSLVPIQHKDSIDSADAGALAKLRKTQLANSDMQPDKMDTEHPDKQELSIINKASGLRGKGSESHVDLDKGLGGKGKGKGSHVDRERSNDKNRAQSDHKKGSNRLQELESLPKFSRKTEQNESVESPKKMDKHMTKIKETNKHKRDRQADSDDYLSSDSYEERREAKKRRKEEKKLKKQEKCQRREERRLRREGRRAEKLNSKAFDAGSSSSDLEGDHSEDDGIRRQDLRKNNLQETEFEQKMLEIELRNKALESLRAKKGIGN